MALKKLTTCDNQFEAENIKNMLEENGIKFLAVDETVNKAVVSGNLPGIAISVEEEDYDRAKALIQAEEVKRQDFMPWCPQCGSEEVTCEEQEKKGISPLMSFIIYFLAGGAVGFVCGFLGLPKTVEYLFVIAVVCIVMLALRGRQRTHRIKVYTCKKCGKTFTK